MFSIIFKEKIFDVRLSSSGGFKLNTRGTQKWNYIHEKDIKNFVTILNNTGKIKLSIPLNEREAFNLPNDMSVFRNLALITKLLYPENIVIKNNVAVLTSKIKFEHDDFILRRNKLLTSENRIFTLHGEKILTTNKKQTKLTQF